MSAEECFIKVRKFHCKLIAGLASKLDSIPEGNGTMLDNTVIVYLSDSADNHHSGLKNWPVVLIGGGKSSKIKAGGTYFNYPEYGDKSHRTLASLYRTLLFSAGKAYKHFGDTDPMLKDIKQNELLHDLIS